MAEDKVNTTLRKAVINLVPQRLYGGPILDEECLKIDISDYLPEGEPFCFHSIDIQRGQYNTSVRYIPWQDYGQFRDAVINILDATIVNSKQRESIQKLLDTAFFASVKFEAAL